MAKRNYLISCLWAIAIMLATVSCSKDEININLPPDETPDATLKVQIQEVRGMINIGHIPGERFIMTRGLVYPTIIFTDTKTGRSTEIGLYAASQVAKALTELFTDNNDDKYKDK